MWKIAVVLIHVCWYGQTQATDGATKQSWSYGDSQPLSTVLGDSRPFHDEQPPMSALVGDDLQKDMGPMSRMKSMMARARGDNDTPRLLPAYGKRDVALTDLDDAMRWARHGGKQDADDEAMRWARHGRKQDADDEGMRWNRHGRKQDADDEGMRWNRHGRKQDADDEAMRWNRHGRKQDADDEGMRWNRHGRKQDADDEAMRWNRHGRKQDADYEAMRWNRKGRVSGDIPSRRTYNRFTRKNTKRSLDQGRATFANFFLKNIRKK